MEIEPEGKRGSVGTAKHDQQPDAGLGIPGWPDTKAFHGGDTMFARPLTAQEADLVEKITEFVKAKHECCEGHDHSHVLMVTRLAIEVAEQVAEPVDPFIVIVGALFHDLGRVGATTGTLHGLAGAAVAHEYLAAVLDDDETVAKVARVVARHTPTSNLPPETLEEKIVYDADTMERFGWIGVLRGVMGREGSIEDILQTVIRKRAADYDTLLLPVSKRMAAERNQVTVNILGGVERALRERDERIDDGLPLPREPASSAGEATS